MVEIKDVNIWVLKTKTSGGRIAGSCIGKKVAAVGWSIDDDPNLIKGAKDFEDYLSKASYKYDSVNIVKALVNKVQVNDLIWIRDPNEGKYYIGRRCEKSHWKYSTDAEDFNLDMQNQLTDIDWTEIGVESDVPGIITCQFHRRGQTLHSIDSGWESAVRYSTKIYNEKHNVNLYECKDIKFDKTNFFNMLSPDEVEDLIYFYLYSKNNKYVLVPSTNKIGTPHYEYVILDAGMPNKKIYVQAKNGKIDLNYNEFSGLIKNINDEVYLFTRGDIDGDKCKNIIRITDDELFDWLQEEDITVSDAINYWIQFLSGEEVGTNKKGIIFDTNRTYYKEDESEMLKQRKVWAKGTPKRYLNCFNKGDYVLYYSKGKGIFAVGEIIDDEPENIDDGLARNVKLICPDEKYILNISEQESITPKELKQLLKKNFFFASTIKAPFLTESESKKVIEILKNKYETHK